MLPLACYLHRRNAYQRRSRRRPLSSPGEVALALAAGSTITGAAEESGLHRATVYRWLKTHPGFNSAIQQARTEFILARRDDLHYLSNRAMETLLAILDNPRSSPAVLLRASMFILQRSQQPGKGWLMPEPVPQPDGITVTDSATLENQAANLISIDDFTPEQIEEPVSTPGAATECDEMQHENGNVAGDVESCESSYRLGILPSCPVPPEVIERRNQRAAMQDVLDELKAIENFNLEAPQDPEEWVRLAVRRPLGCHALHYSWQT